MSDVDTITVDKENCYLEMVVSDYIYQNCFKDTDSLRISLIRRDDKPWKFVHNAFAIHAVNKSGHEDMLALHKSQDPYNINEWSIKISYTKGTGTGKGSPNYEVLRKILHHINNGTYQLHIHGQACDGQWKCLALWDRPLGIKAHHTTLQASSEMLTDKGTPYKKVDVFDCGNRYWVRVYQFDTHRTAWKIVDHYETKNWQYALDLYHTVIQSHLPKPYKPDIDIQDYMGKEFEGEIADEHLLHVT
jgi:hypothetical protein